MSESEFAKTHLRDHLSSLIISPVSEGFWSIYASAKELCERNETMDQLLRTFQNMLTRIPEWTDETLSTEVERIQKVTKCNYLDDLLMGVFIAYMKSFASLHYRGSSNEIKIDFDRPTLAQFVHELYKHSARKLWQTAYLFKTVGVSSESQARNRQEIQTVVAGCLEQVIRGFLPWESIAKKYFSNPVEDVITESVPEVIPEEKREVKFDEESESEYEDSEEEGPPMVIGEETTLDIPEEEEDEMKKLESRVEDSLVLNL
jgi:hypothetical protein